MELGLIVTIAATGIGVVGSNIALIAWLRSDMKAFEVEVRGWREEIHKDMKDFHGRMERQDAEFKGRLEKLDAEFKSHMMYLHGDKSSD